MLSGLVDKVLSEDENNFDTGNKNKKIEKKAVKRKNKFNWKVLVAPSIVFLLALIPRLLYIFAIGNPNFPGWYTDTFHHWQIAYLSKEIGFHHGFLRLWDFKGMEFFWGLLHPLVLAILFSLTGSISILIPRLLSTFGGSVSIVLLYLLIKKYFNKPTAWAVAIFASFFPITLFSNTVGMQEELAQPFIFGALLIWVQYPILAGIFFVLASMVRAEYWLFAVGLVFAMIILRKRLDKVLLLIVVYTIGIIVYMKYLVNYTGNWIYPIYWNFLASVKGEWFQDLPVVGEKLLAKHISQGIFAFGVAGALITLIKKPKSALLYLFGFGNIIFIGFMVGLGSYVKGYIPRFWVDRLYNWPYLFTAILIIILFFYVIPNLLGKFKAIGFVFAGLILVVGLAASQFIWKPINLFMQPVEKIYNTEKSQASEIAKYYQRGKILLPEDRPYITYFLAHDYNISGKNMIGQMFDPFYYFEDRGNPFKNWSKDREKIISWLKDEDIQLIVLTVKKPTYLGLIKREPKLFEKLPSEDILLYKVVLK